MSWSWVIPGSPIAKGRARIFRDHRTHRIHGVTPKRTVDWESRACFAFRQGWSGPPLDQPLLVSVCAVFPRPKKHNGKGCSPERLRHLARPDADNVLKASMDALTKSGVVRDDSIICVAHVAKWYASIDEGPSVEVKLELLGGG